ncbi:MlaC/ttg2D family ABC transporter substrate-binding protein [Alysiella filiformis]|uniref:Phospholipid transport system substrate-binding protein n=1 Tax=Alysiella filiformis DSM 16848 TaxID=1120981 RepID=A0A286EBW9_9NEIS|nr:ABC transporter substrate-binding protein [Alysiella filiformis]QMT31334.1 ABC transporter substrate-binding protein [Alysiella filiformis]UBQ55660.1 ABC transporter substrate-binding protein [Alysiella filiformis DSM 16848]SOD68379.1 phospholipid transport system substrate-binding protein [Alysiella filiformis DSM 16848]
MKKSAFISAISMGVMSISMAFADPAAVSQVRENATQILKILNKANGSNDAQIRREAENYITPYFDFDRMTALAVGQPWRQASPAQKKELVEGFKVLIRSSYTGSMAKFRNANVKVDDKTIDKANGDVLVKASVGTADGKPVNVDFTTRKDGNKYRVYNVAVEGASLVTVYRQQFNETVKTKGIDGLITELKSKNGGKK